MHWPDKRVKFEGQPTFFVRYIGDGWCLLRKVMKAPSMYVGMTYPARVEIKAPLSLVTEMRE